MYRLLYRQRNQFIADFQLQDAPSSFNCIKMIPNTNHIIDLAFFLMCAINLCLCLTDPSCPDKKITNLMLFFLLKLIRKYQICHL